MKTETKRTLTIILGAVIGFILLSSFLADPSDAKYLTVRTCENVQVIGLDPRITIVYEDGKTEEIELEKLKNSNFTANTKKINEVLNKIAAKGYVLLAVSGTGGDIVEINTYTFLQK